MKKLLVHSFLILTSSSMISTQVLANYSNINENNIVNQTTSSNKKFNRTKSVENMMQWFNYIADKRNPFIKSDLEKYFTPNFIMRMNGNIKVTGYDELYNHFQGFRDSELLIQVSLPFEQVVIPKNPKKLVTKYTLNAYKKGELDQIIWDLAIWTFSNDNRIEYMDEVAFVQVIKPEIKIPVTQIIQSEE
ncbi:hypothetical protein QEJ31_14835 [Pigmentibacter sp. JX0631]|uniref:hypothetical protein n=1 Tax=Pigmentibacter sp. JX0631 TaxID=2976982 RepID=UPI00246921C4|nr:hypothetical protein [Pigmentibacter sp. JX0631]WGL59804.1 hypothetical protein QEJ31_14835 [Pigmentibacter sp. JX0631]